MHIESKVFIRLVQKVYRVSEKLEKWNEVLTCTLYYITGVFSLEYE